MHSPENLPSEILLASETSIPSSEAVHPRFLSEQIGYGALARYVDHPDIHGVRKIWALVELGMTSEDTKTQQDFFDAAELRIATIRQDPAQDMSYRIRTEMIAAALPTLQARTTHRPLSRSLQQQAYQAIAPRLSALAFEPVFQQEARFDIHATNYGTLCEGLTYAALLHSGDSSLLPFPASHREDKSRWKNANHDLYLLDSDQKIPIQVKRQNSRGIDTRFKEGIITVTPVPIIRRHSMALRTKMKKNGEDVSWYTGQADALPDVFLAQHLNPYDERLNLTAVYAGSRLMDEVTSDIAAQVRSKAQHLRRTRRRGVY